jgi:hypothetical protein
MKTTIVLFISLLSLSAFAKEKEKTAVHRQHGAHQHGAGTLGVAFEGAKGRLEFKIPSDSIVGFEYTPKTDKDKKTKTDQLAKLEKNIADMVVFDAGLKCVITKDKVEVVKDEAESKEAHAEHSDTFATFDVLCAKSPEGSKIVFNFQKYFPKIQDLDVQIIAGNIQKSVEAKKNNTSIELK